MPKKSPDIIAIGGLTVDISFPAPEGVVIDNSQDILRQKLLAFEVGAKISIDTFRQSFGGGAANVAANLAHSGFFSACFGQIGDDHYGAAIRNNIKELGVSDAFLKKDAKAQSGVSFILVSEDGERLVFSCRGANDRLAISAVDQKKMASADWLYIATLSDNWKSVLPKIFSVEGPRIAWNPGLSQCQAGAEALSRYLRRTDLFALNRDEALELLTSTKRYANHPRSFWSKTDNLLKAIFSFGPRLVLITDGPAGAYAYGGDQVYFQPPFKEKKRVDATGMGDRFNSSVLAGLILSDGDIKLALRMASQAAAAKIEHLGAQAGMVDLRKMIKKR